MIFTFDGCIGMAQPLSKRSAYSKYRILAARLLRRHILSSPHHHTRLRAQPGAADDCESPPAIDIAMGRSASLARPKSRNLTKIVPARTTKSDAIKSNRSPQDFRIIESGLIITAFFLHRLCLSCVFSEGIIVTN